MQRLLLLSKPGRRMVFEYICSDRDYEWTNINGLLAVLHG